MIRPEPSRRTFADDRPAAPLPRLAPVPLGPRPVPRATSGPDSGPASVPPHPDRPPGPAPLPDHVVPPPGAGRGAVRPDPPRDARPRRRGRPAPSGRTVPGQAAASVLAGDAPLLRVRGLRGAGPVDPR